MFTYKSRCRFQMIILVGDRILEIRPRQIIKSEMELDSPYLTKVPEKRGRPKINTSGQD